MAVKYGQRGVELPPRRLFTLLFFLLYLLPLTLFGMHSLHGMVWGAFFGFTVGGVGLALFALLFRWWESVRESPPCPPAPNLSVGDVEGELERRIEESQRLISEREEFERQVLEQGQELYRVRGELEEVRQEKESIYAEYQQAVSNQRARLESNQELVAQLENKVRDLSFEIRTLLRVDEMEEKEVVSPSPVERGAVHREVDQWVESLPLSSDEGVRTQYDAFVLLHRCLKIAQSLAGASHFSGGAGHFSELSLSNTTIDLRRLFDRLRSETGAVVVAYSRAENRLLFANAVTRSLFGWSSERFARDFSSLLQGGRREWEEAVQTLQADEEATLRLVLRDKAGCDLLVQCCMAMVAKGAFRGCILAVLYRA